jgi:hypothetical protein
VVELEDVDPDTDIASILTTLKDTWTDLLSKGHYALMHVCIICDMLRMYASLVHVRQRC